MAKVESEGVEILRVLCGSRAYGLNTPDSDFDYHSVYLIPTTRLLSIGPEVRASAHVADNEDNTAWELGHFLKLALKGNPTVLETFVAPMESIVRKDIEYTSNISLGVQLRALFPYVLSKRPVFESFRGYASSQRHKMGVEDNARRNLKAAIAFIRTVLHGTELLSTGTYSTPLHPIWLNRLLSLKTNDVWDVETQAIVEKWQDEVLEDMVQAYDTSPLPETPDITEVNRFLLRIRRQAWTFNIN